MRTPIPAFLGSSATPGVNGRNAPAGKEAMRVAASLGLSVYGPKDLPRLQARVAQFTAHLRNAKTTAPKQRPKEAKSFEAAKRRLASAAANLRESYSQDAAHLSGTVEQARRRLDTHNALNGIKPAVAAKRLVIYMAIDPGY